MVRSALAAAVLLFAILGLGIRYRRAQVLQNLYQTYNGSYGNTFAAGLVGMLFIGSSCRYVGTGFMLVHLSALLASPTYMATISALLVSGSTTGSSHEHLILNVFLTSMYLRFSGSKPLDMSLKCRFLSRVAEYTMFMSSYQFHLWNAPRLLAFLIIVSTGRSHEALRLSCYGLAGPGNDRDQAKCRFDKLDRLVIEQLLSEHAQRLPERLHEHLTATGIFKYIWYVSEQYSFLWVDGTGLLFLAALTILGLTSIEMAASRDVQSIGVAVLASLAFMYLVFQCFPALLSRLIETKEWLQAAAQPPSDGSSSSNRGSGYRTIDVLQVEWFYRVRTFLSDLASKGVPEQLETKIQIGDWQDLPWIRRLEGYELMPYVIIFSLVRAAGRLLLCCILYILRATKLDALLVTLVLDPLIGIRALARLSLAPISDIWRTMQAIVEAEVALNNKIGCTSGCMSTLELSELSCILQQQEDEVGAQALISTIYICAEDATEGPGELKKFKKLLLQLHKFYIVPYQANGTGMTVERLKNILQEFCDARYRGYQTRACDCINDENWKLLKAQLYVTLLLHRLVHPGSVLPTFQLEASALYPWVSARQQARDCSLVTFLAVSSIV